MTTPRERRDNFVVTKIRAIAENKYTQIIVENSSDVSGKNIKTGESFSIRKKSAETGHFYYDVTSDDNIHCEIFSNFNYKHGKGLRMLVDKLRQDAPAKNKKLMKYYDKPNVFTRMFGRNSR
ncbi:MAG: hypothetical protein IJ560_04165 [Alphaproteobacteria bacterium]|nr:hypothetical protein [Alphaproteobacteria bacterium]